ncbi:MAG TPA: carboxymuconolactone decarboxylase family protein [Burkholderiales bacterium]
MNAVIESRSIETALPAQASTIARDLRLNLKRILEAGALERTEAFAALLAVATAVGDERLGAYARAELEAAGFSPEEIAEAAESAAIMGMLNVYYRFRHMLGNEEEYRTAGLRMTALARPVLGKERFEMLAFAVSVLNGCESCIRSHEKVLRDAGVSVDKVHDLARLAAVVKGLNTLSRIPN